MTNPAFTVHLVDDDAAVRDSLKLLLGAAGYAVADYEHAQDFLARRPPATEAGCLLLDIRMPGLNGLELQGQLQAQGLPWPIIFMTAHGDVPQCAQAFRAGAVDFLSKPLSAEELFKALRRCQAAQAASPPAQDPRHAQLATLTAREREVMQYMLAGEANKQIAHRMGLNARTVETHRLNLYRKLEVSTLAELLTRFIPVQDQL